MAAAGESEDLVEHGNWAANIVEKYNATAKKLFVAQGELKKVQEQQGHHVEELQKMATQNSELDEKQQKAIQDLQAADKDMHETLKTLMEERLSTTKAEVEAAMRTLDESLTPKFHGLERGIEDVVELQKEMQAKTLPRWKADLGTEIQSLRTDLEKHRQQTGAKDAELAAAQGKAEKAAQESQASLEKSLRAEIDELRARLGKAEQAAEVLTADHGKTKSGLADVNAERAQEKVALDKRFSSIEGTQDGHKEGAGKLDERVEKLEKVSRQTLYDFEDVKSRLHEELSSRAAQLDARSKELQKVGGEAEKHIKESLSQAKETLEKALASEVEAMNKKVAAASETAAECNKILSKNTYDWTSIHDKIEEMGKRQEQQSKAEAKEVLQTIRVDEGVRLAKLEDLIKEVQSTQLKQSEKQQQDLKALGESVSSAQSSTDQKLKDLENSCAGRLKIIQQAVDELAQMFQEFGTLQQQQEAQMKTLGDTVHLVEIRLWPWKTRNSGDGDRPANVRPTSASRTA